MPDMIYGRNPVLNALGGKRLPNRVLISKTMTDHTLINACQKADIKYELVANQVLDRLAKGANHQGVICFLPEFSYIDLDKFLMSIHNKEDALLVILDGIEDPVNFGSIIRTSSCFGVDGIIIAKDRQVQLTPVVSKVATGAEEFVPIISVVNISATLVKLKKEGFWIASADGSGTQSYDEIDYSGRFGIIIGSEGKGVSQLVLKNSDFVVRIPISGPITSLNASIAGAIMLAQTISSRHKHNKK